ncbi:hypothetical protein GCM10011367_15900 [Marinicauda pacifica]|jgi:hypothetical protein|uniref:Uncharacterized protein n=1 Tax=Marinicauda pacifica TaxID=1133559 RepID=A0A4S2HBX5_9PROT|nr:MULTISPECIES: hypothetical protein [Marinicauda]TGY93002.1 hypothetical protein E5162_08025 [Marinicauda pacifica]GGE42060.1 hypothetical protein GCM10011367_15900 [Marinicauda pacifica]
MTEITALLARLVGIYFLVAGLGIVVRRKTISEFIARYRTDPVLSFMGGVMALWFGLVILALHWQWGHVLAVTISVIGLLAVLKGVALILLGNRLLVLARPFDENLHVAGIWGLVVALVGAGLTWAGFAA